MKTIQGHLVRESLSGYLGKLFAELDIEYRVVVKFYNQNTASIQFVSGRCVIINFPAIDETKPFSYKTFLDYIGFALHELCHAKFTDDHAWTSAVQKVRAICERDGKFYHNLVNGLEDVRIEKKAIDTFTNVRFASLLQTICQTMVNKSSGSRIEADLKNVGYALAILGRLNNGYNIDGFKWDWNLCPWASEIKQALSELSTANDTYDVTEIANDLYDALKVYRNDTPEQPEQPEQSESGEGDSDQSDSDSNDDNGSDESLNNDDNNGSDDGSNDDSEDDSDDDNGSGSDQSEDDSEDDNGSETSPEAGDDDSGKHSLQDNPDVDELDVELNQGIERELNEYENTSAGIRPEDLAEEDGYHTSEGKQVKVYNKIVSDKPKGYALIKKALWRLIKSDDFVGVSKKENRGKVNRKDLTGLRLNRQNIFTQTDYKDAENTSVSIFFDQSSSMEGKPLRTVREVAIQLSDIISKTDSELAVRSWTSGTIGHVKNWSERFTVRVKEKLALIPQGYTSGTPFLDATHWAITDLAKRPNAKKVLIQITDGAFGTGNRYLQDYADSVGIKLVIICLEQRAPDNITNNFDNVAVCTSVKDLFGQVFASLITKLARGK